MRVNSYEMLVMSFCCLSYVEWARKKRSFRNCYVNKSKFNASYDEFDIIQREWHSGAETPTETIKNVTGNKLKATYILLSGTKLILRALTVIRLMNLHFD